ncbi:hypothetical protein ONZ43_g1113 [Nemania bipapillata]|uniref:Uncharacterized protein n=1 Tax=Nemania bipapillata TaxID=110536 RepID=A0ACC2J5R5_9PEZI|nr:hypothetical protein ONZ43_g1113 [Nemania bipapillata]
MAPPTPLPAYVYKIVPSPPPSPIPPQYPLSDLDQQDGFVHLSIATQIPITAGLFFKESTNLWILRIRFKPEFHGTTTWEVTGCPHLYGNFGADDVEDVKQFTRSEGESWKDAMERQRGFLI